MKARTLVVLALALCFAPVMVPARLRWPRAVLGKAARFLGERARYSQRFMVEVLRAKQESALPAPKYFALVLLLCLLYPIVSRSKQARRFTVSTSYHVSRAWGLILLRAFPGMEARAQDDVKRARQALSLLKGSPLETDAQVTLRKANARIKQLHRLKRTLGEMQP
jgi:hypothetical protein